MSPAGICFCAAILMAMLAIWIWVSPVVDEKEIQQLENEMAREKQKHTLVILDENPHREYRHVVKCRPTHQARDKVVFMATCEHSAAYLYFGQAGMVACCHAGCVPERAAE